VGGGDGVRSMSGAVPTTNHPITRTSLATTTPKITAEKPETGDEGKKVIRRELEIPAYGVVANAHRILESRPFGVECSPNTLTSPIPRHVSSIL